MSREATVRRAERPLIRLVTFSALGLYGVLRWNTLMRPGDMSRLLGMLALAIIVAGLGAALAERERWFAIGFAAIAVIAMFCIAGIPFAWVRHFRIEVTANAIGQGLTALPNVLVPYLGINPWVRVVIVLGAGVLLLDAALMVAFSPRSIGDMRRGGAALPLVALAVVPSTLVKPHLPYLQGLILFALLAAFLWGERAPNRDVVSAIGVIGLAGVGGLIVGPRIDPRHAWINYRALAGALAPSHIDRFNWAQTYGPLRWPQIGQEVFDVQAKRPDYWKVENLDAFLGSAWIAASVGAPVPTADISPSALATWTQSIQVTIRGMRSIDVIAAGSAQTPTHVSEGALPGLSQGTWQAGAAMQPGETYRVATYSPRPTPAQLEAAGTDYPQQLIPGYLTLNVPVAGSRARGLSPAPPQAALMAPFGSTSNATYGPAASGGANLLRLSPYARAYALALRLERGAGTPYAFVKRVLAYLGRGYSYDQATPTVPYPLEAFLFETKRGYCQQFAGAMAMLLRMGGVPARVAVGFTQGRYDTATREWIVADTDAHAWVEAWFPGYGWVRFDPTPSVAPALGGHAPSGALSGETHGTSGGHGLKSLLTAAAGTRRRNGGSFPLWLVVAPLAVVLAAGAALLGTRRRRRRSGVREELLAELERALRRCGRPIADGVTLAALEERLRVSPGAAAYVRAIRVQRYGGSDRPPTLEERRALRAQLAVGLGAMGRLRALWALPPRRVASGDDG
jgi:hypothetical protein